MVLLGQLLLVAVAILDEVLFGGEDDVLVDVLEERLDERRAYLLDSLLEPHIIVEEVPLAGKDAKVDCKVIVLAVDDLDQTVLDLLSDVKDSGQVHYFLVVSAAFTDASNEQVVVILPQFPQDGA